MIKTRIEWEGSPWGSGSIENWAYCGLHTPGSGVRFQGYQWGSKVAFGGWTQLLTVHRLLSELTVEQRSEVLQTLQSSCQREFRIWRDLFGSTYRPVPFAPKPWRHLVLTSRVPPKLNTDAARASRGIAAILQKHWGIIRSVEEPATSQTRFRFGSQYLPVTTFYDFVFDDAVVDLKCTQVQDYGTLSGTRAHLRSDLQAAIHWQMCVDRGYEYWRLYYVMDASRNLLQVRRHLVVESDVCIALARLRAGIDSGKPLPTLNPRYACHSCSRIKLCTAKALKELGGSDHAC